MITLSRSRSKAAQTRLITVASGGASPTAILAIRAIIAAISSSAAVSWYRTRRQDSRFGPPESWRGLGVTANARLRPRETLLKADGNALIPTRDKGNEDRRPRQGLTPRPTIADSSW